MSGRREEVETRICEFVFPSDTNHLGTLYGGTLMAWMDKAAGVAALRRAGSSAVVTAAVEASISACRSTTASWSSCSRGSSPWAAPA